MKKDNGFKQWLARRDKDAVVFVMVVAMFSGLVGITTLADLATKAKAQNVKKENVMDLITEKDTVKVAAQKKNIMDLITTRQK